MTGFSVIPADTTPEAFRVYWAALRRLDVEGRARIAFDLSNTLHAIAADGIRHRHPEYGDDQVRLSLLRLSLGAEAFRREFPDAGGRA